MSFPNFRKYCTFYCGEVRYVLQHSDCIDGGFVDIKEGKIRQAVSFLNKSDNNQDESIKKYAKELLGVE